MESIEKTMTALLADEGVRRALAFLRDDEDRKRAELKEMVLVSGAPHTEPEVRSPMFLGRLEACGLEDCFTDAVGNVFGFVRGREASRVLVEAHMDTVFGPDVPLSLVEDGDGLLRCPGIADNTASMATELSLLRAIRACNLVPVKTLMLGGTVGEEAPGEARGVRHIMETQQDLAAYLCLDSGHDFDIIRGAVSCKRHEITLKGPGGHSWNNWGRGNPVHALGRAVAAIADIEPEQHVKTTYNVGLVSGGTSVNSIPSTASMHVDIRSLDNVEKDRLEARILDCVKRAVEEENRRHPDSEPLLLLDRPYGDKPGGSVPEESVIVQAALASARAVDVPRRVCPPSSTNANFPISAGIPSLCVNSNGRCGNMHSPDEWYDPKDSWKGAQALLLLVFALAGLEGVTEPLL